MSPLVSVCLLSYNHEKYIEQCIVSILGQTYSNIEIIYLDNASSDKSYLKAVELLRGESISTKLFRNEVPKSIPENLNFLLAQSSGKYLTILSTDDWFKNDSVETKVKHFEVNSSLGLVYGSGWYYYEKEDKYQLLPTETFKKGRVFEDLLIGNFVFTIGAMLRKDVIETLGGWDESIEIDDWDMWLRIADRFDIDYVTEPTVYYRRHSENYSSNFERMLEQEKKIISKYKGRKNYKLAVKTAYLRYGVFCMDKLVKRQQQSYISAYANLLGTANGRRAAGMLVEKFLYELKNKLIKK